MVSCSTCGFWKHMPVDGEHEDDRCGLCCRHAPQAMLWDVMDESGERWVSWPKTLQDEWCGEFVAGQPPKVDDDPV